MDSLLQPLLSAGPGELNVACATALTEARAALAHFKALPPPTPFETVVDGWDAIGRPINGIAGLSALFFQTHPDGAVREQAAANEQELSRFGTELSLDRGAWERLVALDLGRAADPIAKRIVEHALRDYRRAGVDKDEPTRQRVRALREELVDIGQEFSRNIAGDRRKVTIADGHAGLAGLPQDCIAAHPQQPDGSVTLTTDPTRLPALHELRAQPRASRSAVPRLHRAAATPANLGVLERMIASATSWPRCSASRTGPTTPPRTRWSSTAATRARIHRARRRRVARAARSASYAALLRARKRRRRWPTRSTRLGPRLLNEQVKAEQLRLRLTGRCGPTSPTSA